MSISTANLPFLYFNDFVLTKVQVMTKKTGKMLKPKEKEKGPPAYSVDDAMNKGRQLPQMLDFHKERFALFEYKGLEN